MPYGDESGLWSNNYELFLQQRVEIINKSIAKASLGS